MEKLTNKLLVKRHSFLVSLFFFLFIAIGFGQSFNLSVSVTGINQNQKGSLMVGIFNTAESFKNKTNPAFENSLKVSDSVESCTFNQLSTGFYAVAIYHDENSDDTLNTKKLGIPSEGVGFSGSQKSKFKPPNFEEAGFSFSKDTIINIEIRYPKKAKKSD